MKFKAFAIQLCLFLGCTFSLSAFSYVHVNDSGSKVVYDFVVDSVKFEAKNIDGNTFTAANLVGVDGYTGILYEVGSPEVPVIRLNVAADSAEGIQVTTRTYFAKSNLQIHGEFKPVLESLEKVAGARYEIYHNGHFKSMMSYPAKDFQIREIGQVRGQKMFEVTLFPVQFVGATNQMNITRSYQVEVQKIAEEKAGTPDGIVFVVGAKFKNSAGLKKYMAKKTATGLEVLQFDATGLTPDQIRKKIKDLYAVKKNLKYVLIIGDDTDVPAMESDTISGITDHYYASIDTSDYATDIQTPDLFVGRISAESVAQLETILLKYTRYIDGDFSNRGWMSHVSFLATDDRWELAEGTHNYVIDTYTNSHHYTGAFPAAEQAGGDKLYAVTYNAGETEVMQSLLAGRSIVNYSGHGANTFWDAPRVTQDDVRSLSKSSSLPFVISNACITGDFRVDESFAETWQRSEWGSVMYWGSMDSTYWDEDDVLERRMFDGIFTGGKTTFGSITDFALREMAKFYGGSGRSDYYFETYHMFGDPSIALRIQ